MNTRFNLSVDNADAGRDGQTCLARPNSRSWTGIGKNMIPVHLTISIELIGYRTWLMRGLVKSSDHILSRLVLVLVQKIVHDTRYEVKV